MHQFQREQNILSIGGKRTPKKPQQPSVGVRNINTLGGVLLVATAIIALYSFVDSGQEKSGVELSYISPTAFLYLEDGSFPQKEILLEYFQEQIKVESGKISTLLLQDEVERLLREAKKEASEQLYPHDPTGEINLLECSQQIAAYRCILLRYAGDAIESIEKAIQEGDRELWQVAQGRYHASLAALYTNEGERNRYFLRTQAMRSHRIIVYNYLLHGKVPASLDHLSPFLVNTESERKGML